MSWIVAGSIAVGTGLLKGYNTGRGIDAKADGLERDRQEYLRQMRETRQQAIKEKGFSYQSAMQSQIFGDYEEDRIRRIQQFKTAKTKGQMAGRGATIAKGSTPWNVIMSQKAENETNVALHKFKVDTQVQNKRDAGDRRFDELNRQADSLYAQAENAYSAKQSLLGRKQEMMWTSFLTGGVQGLATGKTLAS